MIASVGCAALATLEEELDEELDEALEAELDVPRQAVAGANGRASEVADDAGRSGRAKAADEATGLKAADDDDDDDDDDDRAGELSLSTEVTSGRNALD